MPSEWQPIDTAPKDGTRVLLWLVPTAIAMPFGWRGGRWMGDDYPLNMAEPSHWMPMPEPPKETPDVTLPPDADEREAMVAAPMPEGE